MLKNITIKKDYLLIGASLLLLFMSYQLAFKKTLEAWHIHKQLNSRLIQASDLSFQPVYLERKNHNLDNILNLYKTDTVLFRSNAISAIAAIAEKEHVKLSEVPRQDPLYHTDQFIVQKLDFEGAYFNMVKVLNTLQATHGFGVVRSAGFKLTGLKNAAEDQKLVLEVYLETLK